MRFSREPALLLISLIAPIVQVVAAFALVDNGEAAGLVNAAAVAVAGALTAAVVSSDRLVPAITGAVTAVLAATAAFGLDWTPEQQALLIVPVTMLAGYVVRDRVTAPAPAESPTLHAA